MTISNKAIVVLVPSLLLGLGAPAWSGSAEQAAPIDAQVVPPSSHTNPWFEIIRPIPPAADVTPRDHKERCKASQLYSQHDVVGDPEACFMNHYSLGGGTSSAAGVP